MKNVRRVALAVFVVLSVALPLVANAQFSVPTVPSLTNMSVFQLVTRVMNWMLGILGVLAVVFFVVSGIFYITANGDQEQIDKAKNIMLYAIVGLVIALVGLIIVNAAAGLTGAGAGTVTGY
jgi:hypothetical protein